MSNSQKTSRLPQYTDLPQNAIKMAVGDVIETLYCQAWLPRAVRQFRTVKAGTLEYIDYAVPCFELATILKKSPQSVAIEVVRKLSEQDHLPVTNILSDAKFEAVNGYVNICLSEISIQWAVRAARNWFKHPSMHLKVRPMDTLLIVGPKLDYNIDFGLTDKSLSFIDQLYGLLHKRHQTTYLVSDFSEQMVDYLTAVASAGDDNKLSGIEYSRVNKAVRAYLSHKDTKSYVHKVFSKSLNQWRRKRITSLKQMPLCSYTTIYESDLVDQVNEFLSKPAKELHKKNIILDSSSKAVYYEDGSIILPLRSASGLLHSTAFMLYQLETMTRRMSRSPSKTLIVFAPHKLHLLIHSYTRLTLKQEGAMERLICFDPTVSQADLQKLSISMNSFSSHFGVIVRKLSAVSPYWYSNQHKRQALLTLVDMPTELSGAISKAQLPLVFDTTAHSLETLTDLGD